MKLARRLILALTLMAGISPAIAQVPPPVPALPDTERRTSYSISASTCACNVNFALYGDSTDYANWLTVWVNGVQVTQSGNWTIASPSGSLATLARPITDAVLTFINPQTGTVQIVGARRPRRTSQFPENRGVAARDLNQVITDLTAQNREFWDRQARTVQAPPGETLSVLSPLAGRANMGACFDSGGNLVSCVGSSAGSFSAGTGITFTGTGPTVISWNSATAAVIGTNLGVLYNNGSGIATSSTVKITTNIAGTPSLYVGAGAGGGDDTGILVGRTLAPVSGLLNSHAYRDETVATSNATASAFSGYAAFDAAPQIIGANVTHMNHIHGFQSRPVYSATGTVDEFAGLTTQATITSAGVIGSSYGVLVTSPIISGGGAITTQTAFYSNPLSGATTSYFLFGAGVNGSTANPSVLNGDLYIGGRLSKFSAEVANVQFNGSTQYGWLFADTYAVAGTTTSAVFVRNNATVGTISTTLAATGYNTSSDERLKNFLGSYDAKEAERIIRADPVREFEWKFGGGRAIGWGAQKSFAISPDLASPGDWDPKKKLGDKGFKGWGVDMGKRTPYLWAAMTDVLDRLDAIEQRINHAESISRPANNAGIHYPRLGPNDGAAKAN